eukprot:3941254-Rhodomonas_salina.1
MPSRKKRKKEKKKREKKPASLPRGELGHWLWQSRAWQARGRCRASPAKGTLPVAGSSSAVRRSQYQIWRSSSSQSRHGAGGSSAVST